MHTSNLQISLLDRIYSRLFAKASLLENKESVTPHQNMVGEFRTEGLFSEMEQWINLNNRNWMRRLDKACPYLTPADRQLVILLYLGFSSTSIAFLTDRPSKQAVYTARCRLRKRLLSANHETILDMLATLNL